MRKKKIPFRSKRKRGGATIKKGETFTGVVQASERGFAFIIPDDGEKYLKDFFVPRSSLCGAYDGDKVLAEKVLGTDDEARVLKVLERGHKKITGTLEVTRKEAFVYPDSPKLPRIFVRASLLGQAQNGDKVVCEITAYPKGKAPDGRICEVLGESGELFCEELAIIRAHELREEFPDEVINEAASAAAEEVKIDGRRDLREKLIITIDGEDTRDIDDGVSLEKSDGNYVLGVHIADVSNYVKYRSALDNEAYARGTSVYFPDRVLPMLPKELSNGACSLNEGEDRYAMSCVMTFNARGERIDYEIFKSVIKSRHRMTYTAVTAICNGDGEVCKKYGDIVDTVKDMEKLCIALEKKRDEAGSVNLDVKEAHIYMDNEGEIVIPPAERTISQRIIEQFMVAANEAVAEFLLKNKAPCLYRVHERPAPEKAETFYGFLRDLGINAKGDCEEIKPDDFRKILIAAEGKPYFSVINKVMLRTMQRARYCEENLGHFGLASKCYCHFTSPIRRYPDLFVHRVLKSVLDGEKLKCEKFIKIAPESGKHCSDRERIAEEAERKVDDLYKLAYMSDRLGEKFDAVISGVTKHGVYCELDNTVEGLIPYEDLPADKYEFFPEKFLLKGGKHSFRLGDRVRICVADCDLGRMKVLFGLV